MEYFWKKKEYASYVMSILILIRHINVMEYYFYSGGAPEVVRIFKTGFTEVAIPLFMLMSGAASFRQSKKFDYKSKIIRMLKSLYVPFLFWNLVCFVFKTTSAALFSDYMIARSTTIDLSISHVLS